MRHIYYIATLLIATTFYAGQATAQWTLNNAGSQLNFISIKAGNIGEIHQFKMLSGTVSAQGQVSVDIHLASVDTLIPIRDERMQKLLFESGIFPTANFSTTINPDTLNSLSVGTSTVTEVVGQLTLKKVTLDITTQVMATRLNNTTLFITSLKPILIDVGAAQLGGGVEQLRVLAGLSSISNVVPITFVLKFNTRG